MAKFIFDFDKIGVTIRKYWSNRANEINEGEQINKITNTNLIEIVNNFETKTIIFGNDADEKSLKQVEDIANYFPYRYQKIRIMPNIQPGLGVPVGTTITYDDMISPSMVGIDPGRGTLAIPIGCDISKIEIKKEYFEIRDENRNYIKDSIIDQLRFISPEVAVRYAPYDLNGFVEIAEDSVRGEYWLIVHYGSGYLGEEMYHHYMSKTILQHPDIKKDLRKIIDNTPPAERKEVIARYYKRIRPRKDEKRLGYLTGKDLVDFINDVECLTRCAWYQRWTIALQILNDAGIPKNYERAIDTLQNGIDPEKRIARKGAIDASKGKQSVILLNSIDGVLICRGKGNANWNCSAPAGAGRIMSRTDARKFFSTADDKERLSFNNDYQNNPKGFRASNYLIDAISPTVEIETTLKGVRTYRVDKFYSENVYYSIKRDIFLNKGSKIIPNTIEGQDSPYKKIIEDAINLLSFAMSKREMQSDSCIEYSDGVQFLWFGLDRGKIRSLHVSLFLIDIAESRSFIFDAEQSKELIKYTNVFSGMDTDLFRANKSFLLSL